MTMALLLLAAEGGHDNFMLWRVVNFLILAGLLGWLIRKHAGPFFAERSQSIVQDIADSRRKLAESEARANVIEERLARLGLDVEELKTKARAEMALEHERIESETDARVKKVFLLAEQEMVAATKAARTELKAYTAQLAVDLAEKKIISHMTPDLQRSLLGAFVRHL
jgi:F-type H+-transporting ATPase subunit b